MVSGSFGYVTAADITRLPETWSGRDKALTRESDARRLVLTSLAYQRPGQGGISSSPGNRTSGDWNSDARTLVETSLAYQRPGQSGISPSPGTRTSGDW
ncbi:hypothetical protein RRG08_062183 [Elysia crispata]|uniref:Uncharacterized protein n=1 Tax=Elysia crispata TaxID=231223 RepID=A0AAE0YZS3_9GAST|nr:hypothetical protein RRG08_062183 [Elysia crispata]